MSGIIKKVQRVGIIATALPMLLQAAIVQGDSELLQTNWIEMVKGYKDVDSGVLVREVKKDTDGLMHLEIAVPKVRMNTVSEMEQVRVIGRRPEKFDFKQLLPSFEYEWVEDYDKDYYGLLVHFREDKKAPVRLYFSSQSGFLQP